MSESAQPNLPDALVARLRLAQFLHVAARGDAAETRLRDLLADAYNAQGITLATGGQMEAALACFEAGIALHPGHASLQSNRANILQLLGRTDAALVANTAALTANSRHLDAWFNRGLILFELERFEEALVCCDNVLAVRPDHLQALSNRGTVLHILGRLEEAIATFQRAAALNPAHPTVRFNESLARLTLGDYAEGWKLYESRWGTALHPPRHDFTQPQWRGEAGPRDRTILLHAEQGLGDTLQFCRYVPLVAKQARVVLEVPATLRRLMASLPGNKMVIAEGEALPAFDLHCPLLSLPLAFGTGLATIPADTPYLRADPALSASWRQRLAALPGLKIGLAWAGESGSRITDARARDRRRSIPLARLAPLGSLSNISLVSLQKGSAALQTADQPDGLTIHDWTEYLEDFADTAALVAELDLVISVDTSVAHLAGALGKPVWVLNRFDACWRWLRGRTDTPWYPTAWLFRQPTLGDWDSVVRDVVAALGGLETSAPGVAKPTRKPRAKQAELPIEKPRAQSRRKKVQ
jgi:Flp pilus assembly protein TadD